MIIVKNSCLIHYFNRYEEDVVELTSKDLRPRARRLVPLPSIKEGQMIMANYNYDEPEARGYWYDCLVTKKRDTRTMKELYATVYLGLVIVNNFPFFRAFLGPNDSSTLFPCLVPLTVRSGYTKYFPQFYLLLCDFVMIRQIRLRFQYDCSSLCTNYNLRRLILISNSRQEAFRERRHLHVCDLRPWSVTLTLVQGQESLSHQMSLIVLCLGSKYDVCECNSLRDMSIIIHFFVTFDLHM